MRYLGIDYGQKRIGIALSDERGEFAFPKETVVVDKNILKTLAMIAAREKVGGVVIGDTRASTGAENPITEEADAFAAALEKELDVPVHRAREAWSSVEAARFAPKGAHDDSAAAAIILQRFLDVQPKNA